MLNKSNCSGGLNNGYGSRYYTRVVPSTDFKLCIFKALDIYGVLLLAN